MAFIVIVIIWILWFVSGGWEGGILTRLATVAGYVVYTKKRPRYR